ncbi:peptidoglycan DD-metalloendopeptidase family protein [Paenibacillus sp. TRM 82003]|nr:peptidoglycan DD-metalloendopeptidase family protein [Paenibacillus sp. TRM 82003]
MNHMDELRRRRQQRIQHILEGKEELGGGRRPPEWEQELEHERLLREDPEYQWKHTGNPWGTASSRLGQTIRTQALASVVGFAAVWAMFQWHHPALIDAKSFVRTSLTQEVRLPEVYAWYEERFGRVPSFIPSLTRGENDAERVQAGIAKAYVAPVSGSVVEPFGGLRSGAGVVVRTTSGSVSSMDTGLVIFAGETPDTGLTVVVRHPEGIETVYGQLGELRVKKDDWVEAGGLVGLVRASGSDAEGGLVYLAVKKGDSFIDPTDVLAL